MDVAAIEIQKVRHLTLYADSGLLGHAIQPIKSIEMKCNTTPQFEEALATFLDRVRYQIRRHQLDKHGIDEDDVVQEVSLRLWRAWERGVPETMSYGYVQRTVTSALVDAVRRARATGSEVTGADEEAIAALPAGGFSPFVHALRAEQARALMMALAALPPRRRRPIQLYLQGYTLAETARVCGLTLDAARKLTYRGLGVIQARIAQVSKERSEDVSADRAVSVAKSLLRSAVHGSSVQRPSRFTPTREASLPAG